MRKMAVGGGGVDGCVRFSIWWSAARMWRDNVWWGVGPGHFDYRYSQYRLPDAVQIPRAGYAHNEYLNTLADWGVAAGLALLARGRWGCCIRVSSLLEICAWFAGRFFAEKKQQAGVFDRGLAGVGGDIVAFGSWISICNCPPTRFWR